MNIAHVIKINIGALIYYIRRCLHDWTTQDCVKILQNIAGAMEPSVSRLVISEVVLPATGADTEAAWLDMTMMTAGGMERTEQQWAQLLKESGFKLGRVFRVPGTNYGAVEAYLNQ